MMRIDVKMRGGKVHETVSRRQLAAYDRPSGAFRRPSMQLFAFMFLLPTAMAAPAAAPAAAQLAEGAVFTGCEDAAIFGERATSPRDTLLKAANRTTVDPVTEREFRGFSLDEAAAVDDERFAEACWSRIDGVWHEQMRVTFDSSADARGWTAENPALTALAHGNYTTPGFIIVPEGDDLNREIRIMDMHGESRTFAREDDVSIADALRDPTKVKTYSGVNYDGSESWLTIGRTHSGLARMTIDGKDYYRPRTEMTRAARAAQADSKDPFVVGYNPKNLRASRQGYDLVTQNPDQFMLNGGKLDIFEKPQGADYEISEQLTVPLGLTLIEEGLQGFVHYSTLVSSEAEAQTAVSSSFGVNVEVRQAAPGAGVGGAIGYSEAKSEMNAMKASRSISSINAYQRFKKYTLVRDMPFSRLSREFIDALMDARRDGDYGRIIANFGTHYPYAVTYGAAGRLTTYVTEDGLTENYESFAKKDGSASMSVGSGTVSGNISQSMSNRNGVSSTTSLGKTTFVAVGGNGSWNENGFVAGDAPYPILMDLRPIDELLNPINFPDDPEMFRGARDELAEAIIAYMEPKAAEVSNESLLASFEPKELWAITANNIACYNRGGDENDSTVELSGILNFDSRLNDRGARAPSWQRVLDHAMETPLSIECNGGYKEINSVAEIYGTATQLRGYQAGFSADMLELDYAGFINPDDKVAGASDGIVIPAGQFAVGQGYFLVPWQIPFSDGGKIVLHFSVVRLK
jgi:hypothetical protein